METLNLAWVRSFLAVVQSGSFQLAANRLGLAQPTISQHIQKLEGQLGVTLLERSRSNCQPTRAAQSFITYGESLLTLNRRALASVKSGGIRIGASSNIGTYLLQPYLKRYADTCSERFEITIDRNPDIAGRLETGELDIGLMEWWDQRAGFDARSWKREPLVLIVAPDHHWAGRELIDRKELQATPLLGGESGTGTGRLLAAYFGNTQAPPPALQLGSTEAVKQAVKCGLGTSLVLRSCVESEIREGTLVAISLDEPGVDKTLWIIWRRKAERCGDAVPAFVNYMLQEATHSP